MPIIIVPIDSLSENIDQIKIALNTLKEVGHQIIGLTKNRNAEALTSIATEWNFNHIVSLDINTPPLDPATIVTTILEWDASILSTHTQVWFLNKCEEADKPPFTIMDYSINKENK